MNTPKNQFFFITNTGVNEVAEADAIARIKVLARRCEHCGHEPCDCTGPDKSEWCTWCEGWRRPMVDIVNMDDTGERHRVCEECWYTYRDELEEDGELTPWRETCLFCDAPRAVDLVCEAPACATRLDALERREESRP